jgi:brefeldin A-resistance guanine nucleotide exchange factor 1
MPEEHTGQLGFEFAWKELLMRSRQSGMWFCTCFPVLMSPRFSGELMICNSPVFDKEMFRSIWKPIISAITFAFMTFDDDYIIERAIAGFRQCANPGWLLPAPGSVRLCGHFALTSNESPF